MALLTYPILCMSYSYTYITFMVIYYIPFVMFYFHVLFHVLSLYTVSTYCIIIITFQIILHSYTFSYITSDRIISSYKTYHHVLISYIVFMFYFSYYFLFHARKYQRSGYRKLIRARRRCTHCTKQWSIRVRRHCYHYTRQ